MSGMIGEVRLLNAKIISNRCKSIEESFGGHSMVGHARLDIWSGRVYLIIGHHNHGHRRSQRRAASPHLQK